MKSLDKNKLLMFLAQQEGNEVDMDKLNKFLAKESGVNGDIKPNQKTTRLDMFGDSNETKSVSIFDEIETKDSNKDFTYAGPIPMEPRKRTRASGIKKYYKWLEENNYEGDYREFLKSNPEQLKHHRIMMMGALLLNTSSNKDALHCGLTFTNIRNYIMQRVDVACMCRDITQTCKPVRFPGKYGALEKYVEDYLDRFKTWLFDYFNINNMLYTEDEISKAMLDCVLYYIDNTFRAEEITEDLKIVMLTCAIGRKPDMLKKVPTSGNRPGIPPCIDFKCVNYRHGYKPYTDIKDALLSTSPFSAHYYDSLKLVGYIGSTNILSAFDNIKQRRLEEFKRISGTSLEIEFSDLLPLACYYDVKYCRYMYTYIVKYSMKIEKLVRSGVSIDDRRVSNILEKLQLRGVSIKLNTLG